MRHIKRKVYQVPLNKIADREIGMSCEKWRDLEDSIRLIGVMVPVIIDKQGRLWDGVHRVYMSKLIGLKTIPAVKINSDRYSEKDLKELIEDLKKQVCGINTVKGK